MSCVLRSAKPCVASPYTSRPSNTNCTLVAQIHCMHHVCYTLPEQYACTASRHCITDKMHQFVAMEFGHSSPPIQLASRNRLHGWAVIIRLHLLQSLIWLLWQLQALLSTLRQRCCCTTSMLARWRTSGPVASCCIACSLAASPSGAKKTNGWKFKQCCRRCCPGS